MKEKNIFIGILIVALIAIGLFVYRTAYQGRGASTRAVPTTATSVSNGSTVRYTDSGFEPQALTVTKGETVVFINASNGGAWVASNPHPAHTDYPGFDSLQPTAPGSSYSFTFDRIGTWGYHNHINPRHYGSITVTE